MFIKVILPKESQDKLECCYINSSKITEIIYNKELKLYLCIIDGKSYAISKKDYSKLIKEKYI